MVREDLCVGVCDWELEEMRGKAMNVEGRSFQAEEQGPGCSGRSTPGVFKEWQGGVRKGSVGMRGPRK